MCSASAALYSLCKPCIDFLQLDASAILQVGHPSLAASIYTKSHTHTCASITALSFTHTHVFIYFVFSSICDQDILQYGLADSCGVLCGFLAGEGAEVCGVVCEFAGFYEFTQLIQNVDMDTLAFCGYYLPACAKNTCIEDCVDDVSIDISPSSAPATTKFHVTTTFTVINSTGLGDVRVCYSLSFPASPCHIQHIS